MSVTESLVTPVSTNVPRYAANVAGLTEPADASTEETVDASEMALPEADMLETLHTTTSDDAPTCVSETTVESLAPMDPTETSTPELEAVISVAEPLDHTSESEITVADSASLTDPGVEALAPVAPIDTATPDLSSTLEIGVTTSVPSASVSIPVEGSVNLLSAFIAFSSVQTPHETALKPLEADLSTLDIPHGAQILTLPGGLKLVVLPGRYLVVDLDGTLHEFDLDSATGPVTEYDAVHTTDTGLTMTITSITGAVVVVGSGRFTATLPSGEVFEGAVGSDMLETLHTTTSDDAPTYASETTVEFLTPMDATETSTPELEAVVSVVPEPFDAIALAEPVPEAAYNTTSSDV
ncbi:MAG: uncharacterized protein KVP18_002140, partial [Porospora cf. gigantea A]